MPRRLLYSAIGVGIGVAASQLYKSGSSSPGTCTSATCVTIVSTGTLGFLGYLIGRESDELHALRYRAGTPIEPAATSVAVAGEPVALAGRDSLVAVAGERGVELFTSALYELRPAGRRAGSIRNIAGLDFAPRSGVLAVAAASGLYLFPPGTGPGVAVRDGAASAVAAADGRVYLARGSRIEVVPTTADSARGWPGAELGRPVRSLDWDGERSTLWAVTDSQLVALRPEGDSLARVSTTELRAAARRVTVGGSHVAVALGAAGIRLFDAAHPAAPRERTRWTGARFAYDVALSANRLFVAAGSDGLYVLDAGGGPRLVLGLARNLGFAVGVVAVGADAFVLDRDGRALRRIANTF